MEIFLNKKRTNTHSLSFILIDSTSFYDCNKCPYRFLCRKGKPIVKGKFNYSSPCFQRIILLANAKLGKKNYIEEVLPALQPNGYIILLLQNKKDEKAGIQISFSVDDVIKQINQSQLEIKSIFKVESGKDKLMYLIAKKG